MTESTPLSTNPTCIVLALGSARPATPADLPPEMNYPRRWCVRILVSEGAEHPARNHFYGDDATRYARTSWAYLGRESTPLPESGGIEQACFVVSLPTNATPEQRRKLALDLLTEQDDLVSATNVDGTFSNEMDWEIACYGPNR